jgi:spore maturation protein CgeB
METLWWKDLGQADNIRFCGFIVKRQDLPKLYNATKTNLNATRPQVITSTPMRVFDILGCGGFLLTDFRLSIGEHFDIEEEFLRVITIKGKLLEKVRYFFIQ